MPSFQAATLPYDSRPDLAEAHSRAWERIAEAGTWWTGSQRVA
ncbi:MAG: hypothetical protein ACI8TX_003849, partial [Hyphomicrobiaceae bacterium]